MPEISSALPKPHTEFTASFFSQVLSDFLLSSLILNALMYKCLFHVQPFRELLQQPRVLWRLLTSVRSACPHGQGYEADFAFHTDLPR
ncbi:hypothetical protein ASG81_29475 [Paenibacillus sp. Soil522]|nr:hypothetical protein ASG81_29475 [Paenibacillus sp. Soil522]